MQEEALEAIPTWVTKACSNGHWPELLHLTLVGALDQLLNWPRPHEPQFTEEWSSTLSHVICETWRQAPNKDCMGYVWYCQKTGKLCKCKPSLFQGFTLLKEQANQLLCQISYTDVSHTVTAFSLHRTKVSSFNIHSTSINPVQRNTFFYVCLITTTSWSNVVEPEDLLNACSLCIHIRSNQHLAKLVCWLSYLLRQCIVLLHAPACPYGCLFRSVCLSVQMEHFQPQETVWHRCYYTTPLLSTCKAGWVISFAGCCTVAGEGCVENAEGWCRWAHVSKQWYGSHYLGFWMCTQSQMMMHMGSVWTL